MTVVHHAKVDAEKIVPTKLPRTLWWWFGGLSLFLGFLLFIFVSFAILHWRTGVGRTLSEVVPFPAAVVGSKVVWYSEVTQLAGVLDQFNDGSTLTDSFDRALTLAVRRRYIERLAKELEVTVTDEEVSAPDEAVAELLSKAGWSEADYRRYVSRPLALAQKTEIALQDSAKYQDIAKRKLTVVEDHLALGIAFTDIASQYSDDSSAAYGGDIGYFHRDELPAGFDQIFVSELGVPSPIFEVPDGFVIAMVYDVVEVDGARSEVAVRIIKARKATLAEVLDEYSLSQKVWYIVR